MFNTIQQVKKELEEYTIPCLSFETCMHVKLELQRGEISSTPLWLREEDKLITSMMQEMHRKSKVDKEIVVEEFTLPDNIVGHLDIVTMMIMMFVEDEGKIQTLKLPLTLCKLEKQIRPLCKSFDECAWAASRITAGFMQVTWFVYCFFTLSFLFLLLPLYLRCLRFAGAAEAANLCPCTSHH